MVTLSLADVIRTHLHVTKHKNGWKFMLTSRNPCDQKVDCRTACTYFNRNSNNGGFVGPYLSIYLFSFFFLFYLSFRTLFLLSCLICCCWRADLSIH